jgi:uncharacterized protein (TIGR03000 family)
MNRTWLAAATLLLLGPGLSFAQQGRVNPSVVGNPSYTGYGAPPPPFIPGALGNPSYTGYNAPRIGVGFNPSYTGYEPRYYLGSQPYLDNRFYLTERSPYAVYRYNGEGRDAYIPYSTRANYYAPQSVGSPAEAGLAPPPTEDRSPQGVTVEVRVPTPATEVFVEGSRTRSAGTTRTFISPNLEPGIRYTYEIRARWIQDGKEVEQTRRVPVRDGDRVEVDFTKPEK